MRIRLPDTTKGLFLLLGIALALGALVPLRVSAAVDTDDTVINAHIGSSISITTSGEVDITVTPTSGGSQSSVSDTVQVSTNNENGYTLTLADANADTDLVNGAYTISAHTGTLVAPTALSVNTWGYAVPAFGDFDSSYSPALSNASSSSSKWAGVPANDAPDTIKTTASTASSDATTVWYSIKANADMPNGTYSDTVTYTATTNP